MDGQIKKQRYQLTLANNDGQFNGNFNKNYSVNSIITESQCSLLVHFSGTWVAFGVGFCSTT